MAAGLVENDALLLNPPPNAELFPEIVVLVYSAVPL